MERAYTALYDRIKPGLRDARLEAQVNTARAKAMYAEGRLEHAEVAFKVALELDPRAPDAMLGQAAIHLSRGEMQAARKLIDQATSVAPGHALGWALKGEIEAQESPENALAHFNRAVEIDPFQLNARVARARLNVGLDNPDAALDDIAFVQEIRPRDPELNYLRSIVFSSQGRPEQANEALRLVGLSLAELGLQYVFKQPRTMLIYAVVKMHEHEYGYAYTALERYVLQVPNNPFALKMLGNLLLRTDDVNRALRALTRADRLAPNDPQILALLGTAYLKLKDTQRATELLERAVSLNPEATGVRSRLAMARLAARQGDEAIGELQAILDIDRTDTQAASMIGFIYLRRGEYEEALKWADVILERDPDGSGGDGLKGAAYAGLQRLEEARKHFVLMLERDPGDETALFNIHAIDLKEGDVEAAITHLETLLQENPGSVRALATLAHLK